MIEDAPRITRTLDHLHRNTDNVRHRQRAIVERIARNPQIYHAQQASVPLDTSLNVPVAVVRSDLLSSLDARRAQRIYYLPTVRIWPRISPPGETCVCTFAYAAPARIAVTTAARSPAASCWLAVPPATTFAEVIVPLTVPS